jgi:hypothetical protein
MNARLHGVIAEELAESVIGGMHMTDDAAGRVALCREVRQSADDPTRSGGGPSPTAGYTASPAIHTLIVSSAQ